MVEEKTGMNDPSILKRFEVLDCVGSGPHGTVFRASHRLLQDIRSLKVLAPGFAESPLKDALLSRFLLCQELAAPHFQRVYTLESTEEGQLVVEAEWIPADSLQKLLDASSVGTAEAIEVTGWIALTLSKAHAKGLLHLDLKPQNIFLPEGRPDKLVVTDFLIGETGMTSLSGPPPEVAAGQEPTAATDVYLLGKLALKLLGVPDQAHSELQLRAALANRIQMEATRLLIDAVERDPGSRPAMKEIEKLSRHIPPRSEMLLRAREQSGGGGERSYPFSPPGEPATGGTRNSTRKIVSWTGIVALFLLLLFYFSFRSPSGEPPPVPAEASEQPGPEAIPAPRLRVKFSWQVLNRPGEGDPSHHSHTLVKMNDFNLFVLRDESGYPSTVERALNVVAKLQSVLDESGQSESVRFSVIETGKLHAIVVSGAEFERKPPILTLSRSDVVGYNRRSKHRTTGQKLADWYRDRLQSYWDVLVAGRAPRVEPTFPEVALLARIARRVEASSGASPSPRAGSEMPAAPVAVRLEKVLSELTVQERQTLQESVFTVPDLAEHHLRENGH
ncbi:MAG: hypothetical protein ACE5JX_04110 [Acidobacteriota bacterium]